MERLGSEEEKLHGEVVAPPEGEGEVFVPRSRGAVSFRPAETRTEAVGPREEKLMPAEVSVLPKPPAGEGGVLSRDFKKPWSSTAFTKRSSLLKKMGIYFGKK